MTNKIEISRELLAAYIESATGYDDSSLREELRALLAAPVVERQEPVTMDGTTTIRQYVEEAMPDDTPMDEWTKGYEECKRRIHMMFMQPINASPPAPVAVVLPEKMEAPSDFAYRKGWNACLDKVKELNQ